MLVDTEALENVINDLFHDCETQQDVGYVRRTLYEEINATSIDKLDIIHRKGANND